MKQQGDVTFKRINRIPSGTIRKAGAVLAEGEATGHAHRIDIPLVIENESVPSSAFPTFELHEKDGTLYLHLEAESTVTHEEHKPVTLEPGDWEIGRVLEYDYLNEAIERVRD